MIEVGILADKEPLELLQGELVVMSPQDPRHMTAVFRVRKALERALGDGFTVFDHSTMAASPNSLPEPDVAAFRGDVSAFLDRLPRGEEAILVVEVARTSLSIDRRKSRIYGEAGVPVYWLLDLASRRLEVRSEPQPDGEYASVRLLNENERIVVPTTTHEIVIAELLG